MYLDDVYTLSLSEDELMRHGVRIGVEFSAEQVKDLKQASAQDLAYVRSLGYLARRPRSEWEMRDYLKRKGCDDTTTTLILNRLSNDGYINDQKFAESWVRSRRLLKPTSLRRLKQELQQKRVSQEVIAVVLEQEPEAELDVLRELAQKKRGQSRYQDPQKLMAYLLRQGFSYGDVKTVISELT